jgi:hypothetical protein
MYRSFVIYQIKVKKNKMIEISPLPLTEENGVVRVAFTVKNDQKNTVEEYFYELSSEYVPYLTDLSDPFLLAVLMKAMKDKTDIYVRGKVSKTLLRNLHEYQCAWSVWLPELFSSVKIEAEHEVELESMESQPQKYIVAFSGGVDASFTLWDNLKNEQNRYFYPVGTAIFIHGFDIELSEKQGFVEAYNKAKQITDDVGMPLISVATNTQFQPWNYVCGAVLAGCLHLFTKGFKGALISSTYPYEILGRGLAGTNPVTDQFLARDGFSIIHYGATHNRVAKINKLNQWGVIRHHLRVCWQTNTAENCGKCEKCVRTILGFRLNGYPLPECFPQEISDSQIRRLWLKSYGAILEMEEILEEARKHNIKDSWVSALAFCIYKDKIASSIRKILFKNGTPPFIKKLLKV